jgi:hypothetical protein
LTSGRVSRAKVASRRWETRSSRRNDGRTRIVSASSSSRACVALKMREELTIM